MLPIDGLSTKTVRPKERPVGMKQRKQYQRVRLDSGQHRRILVVAVLLGVALFIPVALRLYYLMVTNYDYYSQLALRNQTRSTTVTADRGVIYDRNMNVLAANQSVENVYLDPHELKQSKADIPRIAQMLGEILGKDPSWIEEQAKDTRMRYKKLAERISEETAAKIRSYINENNISGIHLEPNSQRYYPYGSLAAQVIGFTNASNTGSEGIEAAYNSFLEGSGGRVITTKGNNEMDMPFSYEKYVASQQGCNVILTLDATVQACLEKQMEAAIARYDVQNGAFGMVMDVNTGEILAMPGEVISDVEMTTAGAMLAATELRLGDSKDALTHSIPMYITMAKTSDSMLELRNLLADSLKEYFGFSFVNGKAVLSLNMPQNAYEAYLAVLLATDNVDITDINAINEDVAIGFLENFIRPLMLDENVDAGSVDNTLRKLGFEKINFSKYNQAFERIRHFYNSTQFEYDNVDSTYGSSIIIDIEKCQ